MLITCAEIPYANIGLIVMYTLSAKKRVKRKVKILLDNFRKFKNVALLRKNDGWKENVKAFATENKELFDIFCEGKTERKVLKKLRSFNANHVRGETHKVRTKLSRHGSSYCECQIALKVIANRLFGCIWTIPSESRGHVEFNEGDESKEVVQFDSNSLPTLKAVRKILERIEVH